MRHLIYVPTSTIVELLIFDTWQSLEDAVKLTKIKPESMITFLCEGRMRYEIYDHNNIPYDCIESEFEIITI